jgi:hypothetical protein
VKTFYRVTLYTTFIPIDDEMGFFDTEPVARRFADFMEPGRPHDQYKEVEGEVNENTRTA